MINSFNTENMKNSIQELDDYISLNQKEMIEDIKKAINDGFIACVDYFDKDEKFNNMYKLKYYERVQKDNKYYQSFLTNDCDEDEYEKIMYKHQEFFNYIKIISEEIEIK